MAFTTSTAFIGTNRSEILQNLVLGTETFDKGLIQIIQNKFDKTYLQRMAIADDPLADVVATPTVSKTVAKTEVTITPGDMQLYVEFNPDTFQNDWRDYWPQGPSVDSQIPQVLLTPLLSVIGKKVNKQVEKLIWQGDTGGAQAVSYFNGLLKTIDADATVVDIGTPLALTQANIIAELERVLAAVSDAVYENPGLKIVMSHTNLRMYEAANRALTTKGSQYTDRIAPQFGGVPIVGVSGVPQGRIVTGVFGTDISSNFYAQTWMQSDQENFKVDRLQANSDLWFVKATFQYGVNYGYGIEIVNYKGS